MNTSNDIQNTYKSVIDALKNERDELNVKMHLASMEVRDEWAEVEKRWQHAQSKAHQLSKASGQSAHELGEAFSILGDELKETYRRIRRTL
ncbi:MAG: vacuolar-type H+-ATPase subunit D/Vma8 [Arenicella sp.]|jgi:vacuolar-type H+-ATPase subunit D/Vma8